MFIGTMIGYFVPEIAEELEKTTLAQVNIPTAILLWIIIAPMMFQVRPSAILNVRREPKGLLLTTFMNWCIQPFFMYGLAVLFFSIVFQGLLDLQEEKQYIAGAVILGGSPCTAMVFVWSSLTHGDAAYTLVQVLLNDTILVFLYAPTVKLLLSIASIEMPWTTIILSVILFVLVPFAIGLLARYMVLRMHNNDEHIVDSIAEKFKPLSTIALLAMLVLIFVFQGSTLVSNWVHVFLIAVPLILQNVMVFFITYSLAYAIALPHNVACPAAFIASSNFFELGVSVSITAYGLESGAALTNVVGVLVEVPVMLSLVFIANYSRFRYNRVPLFSRPLPKFIRTVFGRDVKSVLILCTGNSSRSQMAEALVNGMVSNWKAVSAGTLPATQVHPQAIAAMAELGYDISKASPKHISNFIECSFDLVVTVCGEAEEVCPRLNGATRTIHIGFDDPDVSNDFHLFRKCRDEIQKKLLPILKSQ